MNLYIVYRDPDGTYAVARLGAIAETVAGPFKTQAVASNHAARLAGPSAVWGTWPAAFQQNEQDYAAQLHVETLPRAAYIVR